MTIVFAQPVDTDAALLPSAATSTSTDAVTAPGTLAIVQAFNDETQFPAVTKIWATDAVIVELK